jgi:putative cardiolipin synthase
MVFDRKSVFFGSYNLDPRSTKLNTEIGVLIDSPKLAGQVAAFMDGGVTPGSAFRLALDKKNHLVWTDETDGQKMEYHKDPGITFRQRFVIRILRMLPIEKYI